MFAARLAGHLQPASPSFLNLGQWGLCVLAGAVATAWLVRYPAWMLVPMIALPLPAARLAALMLRPRARVA